MRTTKTTNKIPAGLMVVPLLMGVLINIFCPRALQIGSFATAVLSSTGAASFTGAQLLSTGTMLKFRDMPQVSKREGVLLLPKLSAGVVIGLAVDAIFGDERLFGLTVLALISAITNSNGSVYTALMMIYGDKIDCTVVGTLASNDSPFPTPTALGASGLTNAPLIPLVTVLVPLVVDVTLGNLDEDCNELLTPLVGLMAPFVGLTLGGSINLMNIVKGGLPSIILGLLVMCIAGPFTTFYDRKISKRSGHVGLAVSTIAGSSIATPAIVAPIDPAWRPYVAEATTQIAAAVVITTVVIPIAINVWTKWFGGSKNPVSGHTGRIR